MQFPLISIAIATLNSEDTLAKTLESIKKQTYPQNKLEVLVIDGGSKDSSKKIAKKFKCIVIPNPRRDIIFAKHIGFFRASGKYLMYLDSDEILENRESLKIKYSTFKKNSDIKAIMPSGYKTPRKYPYINNYINEFGDPFSFFIYRESKGSSYLIKSWSEKYKIIYKDKNCIVFDFSNVKSLPLIDLFAGGCMIDLSFYRNNFPIIQKNPDLVAQLFYLLDSKRELLAITKNDNTLHYSSVSIYKYLKKISSRVKNNVFDTTMGRAGFLGREKYQIPSFQTKKYLFIPYSFSVIFPLLDSIYLTITRRQLVYLIHLPLCIYTAVLIIYYYFLKSLSLKPKIKSYGN